MDTRPYNYQFSSLAELLRNKGHRLLVVQNFNLFYVVENKSIIIKRVLYGKRNYERIL